MRVHRAVVGDPHHVPCRDSTSLQIPPHAWRAIATASTAIVTPISPSSTRQAVGRANQGASQRAPTPSRLNPVSYTHLTLPTNREV